jgi:MYXO-CTERM domain-containing protein
VNPGSVSVVLALMVLALVGMALGWRRRRRAQGGTALPPVPADLGPARFTVPGLLVATTFAGRPLERVVADGLGFRAQATLAAHDAGVLVERAGGAPFLVPAGSAAGTASWALDKGVERDGLTVLGWSLTDADGTAVPVESAFRLAPEAHAAVLAALTPSPTDQEAPHADS